MFLSTNPLNTMFDIFEYIWCLSPQLYPVFMLESCWLPMFVGETLHMVKFWRKSCWRHKTSAPWSGSAWRTARSARACRRQHWWSCCKAKPEPNCVSGTAIGYVNHICVYVCTHCTCIYIYIYTTLCVCVRNYITRLYIVKLHMVHDALR